MQAKSQLDTRQRSFNVASYDPIMFGSNDGRGGKGCRSQVKLNQMTAKTMAVTSPNNMHKSSSVARINKPARFRETLMNLHNRKQSKELIVEEKDYIAEAKK